MTGPTQPGEATLVPLDRLVLDQRVQVRPTLDEAALERYAAAYQDRGARALPAVTAYATADGLLLSDGFHRVEAASRAGLVALPVEVREGQWSDAYEHAVIANTAHGVPLDSAARWHAVHRTKELHPGWDVRRIARFVGTSPMSVSRDLKRRAPARRNRPRPQRPVLSALDRLAALTRPVGRQRPEKWASALIEEHLLAYAEQRQPPPDLQPMIDRLGLLLVYLKKRKAAFPGVSLEVPDD
jgi:ParB-like chromosome segregation protein Spo0J